MKKLARDIVLPGMSDGSDKALVDLPEVPPSTVLIRPGKLIADGREFLCMVCEVSEKGLKVQLFQPLPQHSHLHIEFDNGERHELQLIWQTGDLAGCRFAHDVDLEQLIAAQQGPNPRRQPSLHVAIDALLFTAGMRSPILLYEISPRGGAIECSGWLMIGEMVRIECAALPTLHAKVRWRRPPRYGLVFEKIFQLEDLARACAELCPREPDNP